MGGNWTSRKRVLVTVNSRCIAEVGFRLIAGIHLRTMICMNFCCPTKLACLDQGAQGIFSEGDVLTGSASSLPEQIACKLPTGPQQAPPHKTQACTATQH